MKMASVITLVGLLFVTGCGRLFDVTVSSLGATSPAKYYLHPANPNISPNNLQFQEFAAYIHRILQDKGFTSVDVNSADQFILLEYGIGAPSVHYNTYSSTVYGTTSFSGTTMGPHGMQTFTGHTYGPVGTTTDVVKVTTYPRYLALVAYDAEKARQSQGKEQVQLWSTIAVSSGSSGDLRRVLPVMAVAAERYLGGNTGQFKRVVMLETDKRVREVKSVQP